MTQQEIAEKLNIKRQSYSAYERGVSTPDVLTLKLISEILEVSLNTILGGTDSDINDELSLSVEEVNRINKIKKLDSHGTKIIDTIIELELKKADKFN